MSMFLIGLFTGLSIGTCLGFLIHGMLGAMRNETQTANTDRRHSSVSDDFSVVMHRKATSLSNATRITIATAQQSTRFQKNDAPFIEIPYLPLRRDL